MALRDEQAAAVLEAILEPYRGQLLILIFSLVVFDTADGIRGELLSLLGRHDEAVACLEAAAELCERAGRAQLDPDRTPARSGARVPRWQRGPRPRYALATDAFARAPPSSACPPRPKRRRRCSSSSTQCESCAITGAAIARPKRYAPLDHTRHRLVTGSRWVSSPGHRCTPS